LQPGKQANTEHGQYQGQHAEMEKQDEQGPEGGTIQFPEFGILTGETPGILYIKVLVRQKHKNPFAKVTKGL